MAAPKILKNIMVKKFVKDWMHYNPFMYAFLYESRIKQTSRLFNTSTSFVWVKRTIFELKYTDYFNRLAWVPFEFIVRSL